MKTLKHTVVLSALALFTPLFLFTQTLRIYHIDVEQASATLIVAPNGKSLLVDCGGNGKGDEVWRTMQEAEVQDIDHFVLTHYHTDHFGGIDDLVEKENVTVWQSYDRGKKELIDEDNRTKPNFENYQRVVGEDAIPLKPGDVIPLDETMSVTCISSSRSVIGNPNAEPGDWDEENDNSVSLLIEYDGFRYFIGGDIEEHTEDEIASRDLVMDVDVYVANHHGANTSSTEDFLEDAQPRVVVISNGNDGTYHHPRKAALERLADISPHPEVFQTNKLFKIGDNGEGSNVPDDHIGDPETVDDDGTILIVVDPTTHIYEVRYGTAHVHTFDIKHPGTLLVLPDENSVVMEALLPNPKGSDTEGETVTIANRGSTDISIKGWALVDASGLRWEIGDDIELAAGASLVIIRASRPMSLNNSGDEIFLLDDTGTVRDSFLYDGSQEGVPISTGH